MALDSQTSDTFKTKGSKVQGDKEVQTSSYKISHRDIMYSMMITVNNTTLHI